MFRENWTCLSRAGGEIPRLGYAPGNLLTFHVFCIYKKLFEKIGFTSERFSIRHETQCNVKSGISIV